MKQKLTLIISIALAMFCLAVSGTRLLAQSEEGGPVTLTASLAGTSTVSLGEPILLNFVVKNSNDQPASVYTNEADGTPLVTERFTEVDGKPLVPLISRPNPHWKTDVLHGWNGLSIAGNGSRSWQALASAQVAFPHPGNYVLQVHVQCPYVMGDIDQGSHYILESDYSFPLKLVEAKSSSLQATARRLQRSIMQTTDVDKRSTLIKALFSMPETAYPAWQSLVEEPKLDGAELTEITTELAKLQTIKSADLLAEIIWNPAQPSSVIEEALPAEHLYEMYDAGDPALRKHIEDLHKQHGVAMSKYRME